jgi:hypothetical protein
MLGWEDICRHYLNLTAKDGASLNWGWQRCKKEFYKIVPKECACCGNKKKIQVHHKKPRHLFPELALVQNNLIALCSDCHLRLGHLGSYFQYNDEIQLVSDFARRVSVLKENKK